MNRAYLRELTRVRFDRGPWLPDVERVCGAVISADQGVLLLRGARLLIPR